MGALAYCMLAFYFTLFLFFHKALRFLFSVALRADAPPDIRMLTVHKLVRPSARSMVEGWNKAEAPALRLGVSIT